MAKSSKQKDLEKEKNISTETKEEILVGSKLGPKLNSGEQQTILSQIDEEFILCYDHLQAKRQESLKRLKLYNNQKRDKSAVGDPLLFTVFQTVLAALYDDKLTVTWLGREEGDDEQAENWNALSEFDHEAMEKDILDYEWDWDTLFFGRGYVLLNEFDRKEMNPVAQCLDAMTVLRDPVAISVNGDQKHNGAARFLGWEIGMTKYQLEDNPAYFNLGLLKKSKKQNNLMDEVRTARRTAQGTQDTVRKEEATSENYEYNILLWLTHRDGKKYICGVANGGHLLIRYQPLKDDNWPVIDRTLFPIAHDWDGVSIPDLIEDKQRARSIMINLGMESAKADLYPMYLYDRKKIRNPKDLDFAFNKYVPVQGDTANTVSPIQKSVFHQQVNLILDILDIAAQKSVSAPEIAQGVQPKQERTLGESELIAAGRNVRNSLAVRIFGWSEKRFWQQVYRLYKNHFKDGIDEKVLRIQGPLAPAWKTIYRKDIITKLDPDIYIESAVNAEFKRRTEFQNFMAFANLAIQDPTTNRKFIFRKLGQLNRISKQILNLIFPPTIDELRAEDENALIANNKLPEIKAIDDDLIHMEFHNKAVDTKAKFAHMEAHKFMMLFKKEHPEMFPQPQPITGFRPISAPTNPPQQRQTRSASPAALPTINQ